MAPNRSLRRGDGARRLHFLRPRALTRAARDLAQKQPGFAVEAGLLAHRVWELRDNLTVYEAWSVALAEWLGVEFVTADERLVGSSGLRCAVRHPGGGQVTIPGRPRDLPAAGGPRSRLGVGARVPILGAINQSTASPSETGQGR
jgi:hypothetical protein